MAESVKVVVRCRPFSQKEKNEGHHNIVNINQQAGTVSLNNPSFGNKENNITNNNNNNNNNINHHGANINTEANKQFTFDYTFDENCNQEDVYNKSTRPLIENVLLGYNATIFAYGQTGTGKTFSMQGLREPPELRGIIPNTFDQIFDHINASKLTQRFLVRVSYLEIYNEEIRDLLAPPKSSSNAPVVKLELKENKEKTVYVKDLSTYIVTNAKEMDELMMAGNKNRSVGATLMNAESSRSHSIFSITVEIANTTTASSSSDGEDEHVKVGKCYLVDLAGSERQGKTGATGDRLKEATKINLSLTALGNVIASLVDGKPGAHIPYRDSKLTRLLQDSLGGNAKTLMLATISPASYNYDETMSTLRYANRTKNIKNKPIINQDPKDALLKEFQDEIANLKAKLALEAAGEEEAPDDEENAVDTSNKTASKSNTSAEKAAARAAKKAEKAERKKQEFLEKENSLRLEKEKLLQSKTVAESIKQEMLASIAQREAELHTVKTSKLEMEQKLQEIESKLISGGGVNLLNFHDEQVALIKEREAEAARILANQKLVSDELKRNEDFALQLTEQASTLQEKIDQKTKKIKNLQRMIQKQENDLLDLKDTFNKDREASLQALSNIQMELSLKEFLIERTIPNQYFKLILDQITFIESKGEWHILTSHLTGNNLNNGNSSYNNYNSNNSNSGIDNEKDDYINKVRRERLQKQQQLANSSSASSSSNGIKSPYLSYSDFIKPEDCKKLKTHSASNSASPMRKTAARQKTIGSGSINSVVGASTSSFSPTASKPTSAISSRLTGTDAAYYNANDSDKPPSLRSKSSGPSSKFF